MGDSDVSMKALVEYIAKALVDEVDRIEISEIAGQGHFFDDTTQEVQARVRDYAERVLEVKT